MLKDDILAALPKLGQADLVAIQATCQTLLRPRTVALPAGADLVRQTILSALVGTVGHNIHSISLPDRVMKQFNAKVPKLINFLDSNFHGWAAKKVTQEAFLRMLFGLLHDNIKEMGLCVSIGVMVNHLGRIHEVVEDAFPDYLGSGMGQVILKRFQC